MNSIAVWIGAIGLASAVVLCPQKSLANGFTGAEFLTWSKGGQDSYIQTSVTMATFVATRTNPAAAQCLDEWYSANQETIDQGNVMIRDSISRNSEYHPSGVILLVLEEKCGSFVE